MNWYRFLYGFSLFFIPFLLPRILFASVIVEGYSIHWTDMIGPIAAIVVGYFYGRYVK